MDHSLQEPQTGSWQSRVVNNLWENWDGVLFFGAVLLQGLAKTSAFGTLVNTAGAEYFWALTFVTVIVVVWKRGHSLDKSFKALAALVQKVYDQEQKELPVLNKILDQLAQNVNAIQMQGGAAAVVHRSIHEEVTRVAEIVREINTQEGKELEQLVHLARVADEIRLHQGEFRIYTATQDYYDFLASCLRNAQNTFDAINFIPGAPDKNTPPGRKEYWDEFRKRIRENGNGRMVFRRLWAIGDADKLRYVVDEDLKPSEGCEKYHVRYLLPSQAGTIPRATVIVVDSMHIFFGFLWRDPTDVNNCRHLYVRSKSAGEGFDRYVNLLWEMSAPQTLKEGPKVCWDVVDQLRETLQMAQPAADGGPQPHFPRGLNVRSGQE